MSDYHHHHYSQNDEYSLRIFRWQTTDIQDNIFVDMKEEEINSLMGTILDEVEEKDRNFSSSAGAAIADTIGEFFNQRVVVPGPCDHKPFLSFSSGIRCSEGLPSLPASHPQSAQMWFLLGILGKQPHTERCII